MDWLSHSLYAAAVMLWETLWALVMDFAAILLCGWFVWIHFKRESKPAKMNTLLKGCTCVLMGHCHSHFGGHFGSFDTRLSHGGFDGFGFCLRFNLDRRFGGFRFQ